jgi:hypothetical protein
MTRHRHGKGSCNPNARWTEAIVREMRELHLIQRLSIRQIAARFQTYNANVSKIVRWIDWAHCDHDLRDLPRPTLVAVPPRPPISPEEEARRRQRRRERQREYSRNWRRRHQTQTCSRCVHWIATGGRCGLEYPEAGMSRGTFARDCPAYVVQGVA